MSVEINYILNVLKDISSSYFTQMRTLIQISDTSNTHRDRSEGKKCEMEPRNLGEAQEYMESQKIKKVPRSGVTRIPSRLLRADVGEMLIILHQILFKVWEGGRKQTR